MAKASFVTDYANHPITSRAHLLDIPAYLSRHNLPALAPFDQYKISLDILKGCAEEAGITFYSGDILIVHTGFTEAYLSLSEDGHKGLMEREVKSWCGVEACEEVLRWHWECGFAAVATDTYAVLPFEKDTAEVLIDLKGRIRKLSPQPFAIDPSNFPRRMGITYWRAV